MWYEGLLERSALPDWVVRWGIRRNCRARLREEARGGDARQTALQEVLSAGPIAEQTLAANAQHYEVPVGFFQEVLGKRLKYSSCYWPEGVQTLDASEEAMLALSCMRGEVADGMELLDLGCGWGALTFWLAEQYPASRITAISNSGTQREWIERQCVERGHQNIRVVTADVNEFRPDRTFDRILSVEMLEHVRNHAALFARVWKWLKPDGKLFVHVFTHRRFAYTYEPDGPGNWMARHFFSGGMMPSHDWLPRFQRDLFCEEDWFLCGTHYAKTAEAWLTNLDRAAAAVLPLLSADGDVAEGAKRLARWRVFFMACAELWGLREGREWGVSHYRFRRR